MKNKEPQNILLSLICVFFLAMGLGNLNAKVVAPFANANIVEMFTEGDPLGICPDGNIRCARSKDGTKQWHKGNGEESIL